MLVYGRKRHVDDCPNRLFLSYLKLWCDEASQKESKAYHTYRKAYKSLEKYPLPLQNGKEAIILENFGSKICAMLDKRLEDEASERGMLCHEYLEQSRSVPDSWWEGLENKLLNKEPKKKIKKTSATSRVYIPQKNSGAYALLLTLHRHTGGSWLNKADLKMLAQPLATRSFNVPDIGSHYTAWSSMATLLSKNLVKKFSNPAKFMITEEGKDLASRIEAGEKSSSINHRDHCLKENVCSATSSKAWELSDSDSECSTNLAVTASSASTARLTSCSGLTSSSCFDPKKESHTSSDQVLTSHKIDLTLTSSDSDVGSTDDCFIFEKLKTTTYPPEENSTDHSTSDNNLGQFCLFPGSFRVLLCVDSRELSGDKRKSEFRRLLDASRVDYVERVLQVGDFVWLAQETRNLDSGIQPRELVLDYVVERKCMPDLAQSIRDKRFHEQKIRLKQCGINKVIYLAEEMKQIDHQSLPGKTLRQALVNTMIIDRIFVKYTEDLAETAKYLKSMTDKLSEVFSSKTLKSCDLADAKAGGSLSHPSVVVDLLRFDDFNDDSMKSKGLTAGELLIKQLMQIHGLSYHKAHAIAYAYATPLLLFKAYQACGNDKEKERLLAKIKFGPSQRNVGISVSRSVYHVFTSS